MVDDMLINVKQINEKHNSSLYVLYAENMMIATSYKADMDKFLGGEDSLVSVHDDNLEEAVLIHGIVLNPIELPFEIPEDIMEGRNLWLMKDEKGCATLMEPYAGLNELTEAIETYLEEEEVDIDDFAIVLAEDIDLALAVSKAGTSLQIAKVYG
jgi:hypothetical protein